MGVARCLSAIAERESQRESRSESINVDAERSWRMRAVSMASWLVAPQWTKRAASAFCLATSWVSCLTRGIARLAEAGTAAASAGRSKSSARQFAEMMDAAAAGMMPALDSARARADSKSSRNWMEAESEKNGSTDGE